MVCPTLIRHGICPDGEGCKYSHFLKFCDLCNVTLVTEHSYETHHFGRQHSKRLYHASGASSGLCAICGTSYGPSPSVKSFVSHCQSPGHQQRARNAGLNVFAENSKDIPCPENTRKCETCNKAIPLQLWDSHTQMRRHIKATRFHFARSASNSAFQNKHYVEVSGDEQSGFDFGVVNRGSAECLLPFGIELNAPESVELLDIRLSSQTGARRFGTTSPFIVPTFRGALAPNQTQNLFITFLPNNLGRFEDKIELVFRDGSLSQRFVIVRGLRAVVANKRELDELGPASPYVRPPRREHRARDDDIDGVRYSFPSDIKWAVKLPKYDVPATIHDALASGNPEDHIAAIKSRVLPRNITAETYSRHWSTLLHLEEIQMASDLSVYDMEDAGLERVDRWYKLKVPGLAEKRPSVILGDKIRVKPHGSNGKWHAGYVHQVELEHVSLQFHHSFVALKNQKFDVRFTLGRTPLRRMHAGLSVAWNPARLLFPAQEHIQDCVAPSADEISAVRLFNRTLETNPSQTLAVTSILCQPPGGVPFVVFGPPGTGKTVVVVEAMRQILDKDPSARILACAPSNSAADLIADRLRHYGVAASQMLRLNAPTRPVENLSKTLSECVRKVGNAFVVPPVEEIRNFCVIVTTCISSYLPYAVGVARGHFSHIFIDEAGQALEPEAMISIRTMAGPGTNIVLSGDPKQLGPIVHSRTAIACGLGVSYLDRLVNRPIYDIVSRSGITIVKLLHNYRSHESILSYPNQTFYSGELQIRGDPAIINSLTRFHELVTPGFPIIFHAISGEDMRENSSPSFFNPHEVLVVKKYVQALREDQRLRLQDSQIGVISPYNAQNRKIRQAINAPALKKSRPGTLKVGSVEEFQGQERRVIIVSTVRSNSDFVEHDIRHTLGFVANPRRFNVAMTRAQSLLIIVGDPVVLSLDQMWRAFLDYIHASGGWRGKPRDWDDAASTAASDFLMERRNDRLDAIDQLARRLQNAVIEEVGDSEDGSDTTEDEDGQDRPWRETE